MYREPTLEDIGSDPTPVSNVADAMQRYGHLVLASHDMGPDEEPLTVTLGDWYKEGESCTAAMAATEEARLGYVLRHLFELKGVNEQNGVLPMDQHLITQRTSA